jgi:predicted negative regulator of RcsB-dependent stress response
MKPTTPKETAIICVAAVIITGLVVIPFGLAAANGSSKAGVWMAVAAVIGLGLVLGFRYLTTRKRAQLELEGGEQYRKLAEEYRRLADLAITAQEHTDLKLGDVSAQLDYLREQNASLQKILKDVE